MSHGPDRAQHLLLIRPLEHIAACTGPHRRKDRVVVLEHGDDDDADVRAGRHDAPRGLDAVDARHLDVHQHHIGLQGRGLVDGILARGRLTHHLGIGHGGQQRAQAFAKQGVIVGNQDA